MFFSLDLHNKIQGYSVGQCEFFSYYNFNLCYSTFLLKLLQELFRPSVRTIGRGGSVEADSPGKHSLKQQHLRNLIVP